MVEKTPPTLLNPEHGQSAGGGETCRLTTKQAKLIREVEAGFDRNSGGTEKWCRFSDYGFQDKDGAVWMVWGDPSRLREREGWQLYRCLKDEKEFKWVDVIKDKAKVVISGIPGPKVKIIPMEGVERHVGYISVQFHLKGEKGEESGQILQLIKHEDGKAFAGMVDTSKATFDTFTTVEGVDNQATVGKGLVLYAGVRSPGDSGQSGDLDQYKTAA